MVGTQPMGELCKAIKGRLGFSVVCILSWSNFISKHLFTKCKFIPTQNIVFIKLFLQTINKPQFEFHFKFNYHLRVQATLDREHG
jgi:hypothetical protein